MSHFTQNEQRKAIKRPRDIPIPENLPGYLDAPTISYIQTQFEEVEKFWRMQKIAHPKDPLPASCLNQAEMQVRWLHRLAEAIEQRVEQEVQEQPHEG